MRHYRHHLLLGLSVIFSLYPIFRVQGQLIPDNTLGKENSTLTPINSLKDKIDGGAIRGSNLFHSFREFNVGNGREVYFTNPTGIENILTRVTGENSSEILGKLGVSGNANLFLMNPNGILFGENARLDISGSFTATTTDKILFNNGFEFSATNPQTPPLLNINITPGLQDPRNYQGDITNNGNLTVGGNFTLAGYNLTLNGQLKAGRDLTLQAQENLLIRDSKTNPFIASAGGNLILQGNQKLDIFALNHPQSGLFSTKDMILRSGTTVAGDAHYYSGGNFLIEQLDGKLGNLSSPDDPVIRASGNVTFDSYTGASLHIFAGGSVSIPGEINITGTDTSANTIQEIITLSDGITQVSIDGNTRPTLDIRAGTLAYQPTGITGDGSNFVPNIPNANTTATSANITLGKVKFTYEPDIFYPFGNVLLTNQYQPNLSLLGGDITVKEINISDNMPADDNLAVFGKSGAIHIDARNNFILDNGKITTQSLSSDSGNIRLFATNNIAINDSQITTIGTIGNSGDIAIKAGSLSIQNSRIEFSDYIGYNSDTPAGNLIIDVLGSAAIINSNLFNEGDSYYTTKELVINAESLTLNNSTLSLLRNNGSRKPSQIFLNVKDALILTNNSLIDTNSNYGTAANINIEANSLFLEKASGIQSNSIATYKGNVGDISIKANSVTLEEGGYITANSSLSSFIVGTIRLEGKDSPLISNLVLRDPGSKISVAVRDDIPFRDGDDPYDSYYYYPPKAFGGEVNIFADKLTIENGAGINASSNITKIVLGEDIYGNRYVYGKLEDVCKCNVVDTAGQIHLTANSTTIAKGGFISASSISGTGGNINLIGNNSLKLFDNSIISTESISGSGSQVAIDVKSLILNNNSSISASTVDGGGGILSAKASEFIKLDNNSSLAAQATGSGNAGELIVEANQVSLDNQAKISAETEFGTSGDIQFRNLQSLALNNSSKISASTIDGQAGDITVNAAAQVQLTGGSALSSLARGNGIAGFVNVNTGELNVTDLSEISVSSRGTGNSGELLVEAAKVNLNNQAKIAAETEFGTGGDIQFRNLQSLALNNSSKISASTIDGQAGDITVNAAAQVQLTGGSTLSSLATGNGIAGFVNVNTGELNVTDLSEISVSSRGTGNSGELLVEAAKVNLNNQAKIAAETEFGTGGDIEFRNLQSLVLNNSSKISASTIDGQAGDITVDAAAQVKLTGGSALSSQSNGKGFAGYAKINTSELTLADLAEISVSSKGTGNAGELLIEAERVTLNNQSKVTAETESGISGDIKLSNLKTLLLGHNSLISATTKDGQAGNITINASDSINLKTGSILASGAVGTGNAGFLNILTNYFALSDKAQATVSSRGSGDAGYMFVQATDVSLNNQARISAQTKSGTGGDITLDGLNSLLVSNSKISAETDNGIAGNLKIHSSGLVELVGTGGLSVQATKAGIAGDLQVNAHSLNVTNGAEITVSSPQGQAGNLTITAENLLLNQGKLTAETGMKTTLQGANINLSVDNLLLMRNESLISAKAFNAANGGNVTIDNINGFIVALKYENSDIIASAFEGNGGVIDISSLGIFGLEFRPELTQYSDINASSKLGLNGDVTLSTPNVDPSNGLVELPTSFVEASNKISQSCSASKSASRNNSFNITGRGGIPQNPNEPLPGNTALVDVVDLVSGSETKKISTSLVSKQENNSPQEIIEAQGWVNDENGNVRLIANVANVTSNSAFPLRCT